MQQSTKSLDVHHWPNPCSSQQRVLPELQSVDRSKKAFAVFSLEPELGLVIGLEVFALVPREASATERR